MFVLSAKWRNLIRITHISLDIIWLNIGVEIRLYVHRYIANHGLWTTPIRITTANRVSISALSIAFHWCTKECGHKLFWYCSMNCCEYRLLCITMWSIICSVMYSLKRSCIVGFLGRGTSILSSPVNFIFLGLNGSPGYILFHCYNGNYWLILSWSNLSQKACGSSSPTLLCLWPPGACLAPPGSCLSCPQLAGIWLTSSAPSLSYPQPAASCLTSSAPCLSCPQPAATYLRSFAPCLSCPQPAATCLKSSTPSLSCPQPAATCLTSSAPSLSCPQPAATCSNTTFPVWFLLRR